MIAISIEKRTLGRAKIKEPFWLKNADAVLLRLFTFLVSALLLVHTFVH